MMASNCVANPIASVRRERAESECGRLKLTKQAVMKEVDVMRGMFSALVMTTALAAPFVVPAKRGCRRTGRERDRHVAYLRSVSARRSWLGPP